MNWWAKVSVTYSSFDLRPIILGVKVFCRTNEKRTLWIAALCIWNVLCDCNVQLCTFLTPPNVRSLERIVGRRPEETEAGSRRPIGSPLAPPTWGVCGGPLGSPELSILTDKRGDVTANVNSTCKLHVLWEKKCVCVCVCVYVYIYIYIY